MQYRRVDLELKINKSIRLFTVLAVAILIGGMITGCGNLTAIVYPIAFDSFEAPSEDAPVETVSEANVAPPTVDISTLLKDTASNPYNVKMQSTLDSSLFDESVSENAVYTSTLDIVSDGTTEHISGTESNSNDGNVNDIDMYTTIDGDGYSQYKLLRFSDHTEWEKFSGNSIKPEMQTLLDPSSYNILSDVYDEVNKQIIYTAECSNLLITDGGNLTSTITVDTTQNRISEITIYNNDNTAYISLWFDTANVDKIDIPEDALSESVSEEKPTVSQDSVSDNALPEGQTDFVTIANMNFRASPSKESESLTIIPKGSTIHGSVYSEEWAEITYDGKTGYVYTWYLGAPSATDMYKTKRATNLRASETTSSKILDVLDAFTEFRGIDEGNAEWVKANYNYQTGFINKDNIVKDGESPFPEQEVTPVDENPSNSSPNVPKDANLRMAPDTNSKVIAVIPGGTVLNDIKKYGEDWYEVVYDGKKGYVVSWLINE